LDDSDDEDEDALPASPVRKKRKKGTDRSSAETAPKKKFRPTQQEQEVYTNTRASSAVQSHHRGSAPRLSGQALNDARIEQDGDGPDNDQAAQDECERRGFGAEETRKARAEAKDRQKDVVRAKNGRIQDWRYPALNEVQSITVLKYFDPVSKLEPSPGFIKSITWKCRCCHRTFTAAPGITTNLLGHLNAKPGRGPCPDRDNPLTKGVEPWIPSWAKDDESARVPEPAKGRDLDAMSQRSFMSKWTKQVRRSALETQTANQRRATLVWIVMTSQPFTAARNQHFRRMMARANTAVGESALKSARTIGRDLDKMHSSLFTQAIEAIKTANTKFSIQHDGWTTRNRRAAFLAVHASWIDGNFVRREACIAFNQLGADHTGATFAAHIVSILKENKLWDHWSGVIVSDAAESNIRASRFIQLEVDSEIGSVVPMRHKIVDSLVLCFAHGLNRAVLDGTAAAGAELAMVE
ncbi:unnamed protein product, partial [Tilletia caries]